MQKSILKQIACGPGACSQFFALRDQQHKTPLIAATLFGMQQAVLHILKQIETKKDIDILINEDKSYPIMVTDDADDPDHKPRWRFVIMHPQNADALRLMANRKRRKSN